LIGAKGGGDDSAQYNETAKIVNHWGIGADAFDLSAVCANLFGGTSTFHSGTIGGWREHFTPAIKTTFKDAAGKLLIDLGYETDYNW